MEGHLQREANKKVIALSSGGKDSILALHLTWSTGLKAEALLTMLPEEPESMLYHVHNVNHVVSIAESVGINWVSYKAAKDDELGALKLALKDMGAEVIVTGGIASKYQMTRFNKVADELNIKHYAPLWGWNRSQIFQKIIDLRMDVIVVAVAAYGLNEEWLGTHLTNEKIRLLCDLSTKYRFDPIGEGGDLETFVLDAPLYRKKLDISKATVEWMGDRGELRIKELSAIDK